MSEWNHYALRDPRIADEVLSVRYVGRTVKTPEERYHRHLCEAKRGGRTYRSNWLRQMLMEGVEPEVLSLGIGGEDAEAEWIALYRELGARLTNGTDGGEGASNPTSDVRARLSASCKAYNAKPEVRAKK